MFGSNNTFKFFISNYQLIKSRYSDNCFIETSRYSENYKNDEVMIPFNLFLAVVSGLASLLFVAIVILCCRYICCNKFLFDSKEDNYHPTTKESDINISNKRTTRSDTVATCNTVVSMETTSRKYHFEAQSSNIVEAARARPIQENEYVTMTGGEVLTCCGNQFDYNSYENDIS